MGLDFGREKMCLKLGVNIFELFVKDYVWSFDDGEFAGPTLKD